MSRLRHIVVGIVVVGFAGLLGFLALAWRPAIAPIQPPARDSFPAALVAKSKILAGAGYCAVCHTRAGGQEFVGGYGLQTPFGTIYSTNITPDPDTGIGRWSEAAFARAMHQSVARDGSHLFPAFPYDHFTKVSDAYVQALYAYMVTRPPVRAAPPTNAIPFLLNIRLLQEGWKILFFSSGRYRPDTSKSAEWNRGAYLAEGLSHCGGCHTPRNVLGAAKINHSYAIAAIDNWTAPSLTDTNPTPVPWTQSEVFGYLRTGVTARHGVTAGPMSRSFTLVSRRCRSPASNGWCSASEGRCACGRRIRERAFAHYDGVTVRASTDWRRSAAVAWPPEVAGAPTEP